MFIIGRTFHEHLMRLGGVLGKLQQANLKVKPSKSDLFSTQVHYLGHVISAAGVMPDPAKVEAVREWPVPINQTEVQSFIGLSSCFRRFARGFADIATYCNIYTCVIGYLGNLIFFFSGCYIFFVLFCFFSKKCIESCKRIQVHINDTIMLV